MNGQHLYENNGKIKTKKEEIEILNFVFLIRIQTNIWLYTNRANISWPVTIGFIWPSVLEQMSSSHTPIILDFQVTFINITKVNKLLKFVFIFYFCLDTKCYYNKSIIRYSYVFS